MKLSSLPLQLEQTHASVLSWHTPSSNAEHWLAFCHCSLDSKITIIWLRWIKEGHAFDVGLVLYSITLRHDYLFGNMVWRWKIGILWYATNNDQTYRLNLTVGLVASFKLQLPEFLYSLEVFSDAGLEETLKCEPNSERERDCWYVCSNRELRTHHSLSGDPSVPNSRVVLGCLNLCP